MRFLSRAEPKEPVEGRPPPPVRKRSSLLGSTDDGPPSRHTRLTYEAAAGNPQAYIQMKAGHSDGRMTEHHVHATQVLFPGAADRSENHVFGPNWDSEDDERGTE